MPGPRNYAGALLVLLTIHCDRAPVEPAKLAEVAESGAASGPVVEKGVRWISGAPGLLTRYDRVVRGQQLLVDVGAPSDAGLVRGWLFAGEVAVDTHSDLAPLMALENASGTVRWALNGGVDAPRPLVYEDVAPGTYTVCAQVGPASVDPVVDWSAVSVRCSHVDVTDAAESRVVVLQG